MCVATILNDGKFGTKVSGRDINSGEKPIVLFCFEMVLVFFVALSLFPCRVFCFCHFRVFAEPPTTLC